ncbi:DUF2878 domain-containing protein [Photobacterium japonica]|uniref:DUF2878 domain-containing protein n=1 Tax=Photobacterium japonica TaxID=2910235 RepID=UPI003D0D47A9
MTVKEWVFVGLVFNVFWFLAVLGQNQTLWLTLPLIVLCWWRYTGSASFGLLVGVLGIVIDTLWLHGGIFAFDKPQDAPMSALTQVLDGVTEKTIPLWLMTLWIGFGSFVWVVRETVLGYPKVLVLMAFGIGGTMSYFAGFRLDAVAWPYGTGITFSILLVTWTAMGAVLIWLTERVSRRHDHAHLSHSPHE